MVLMSQFEASQQHRSESHDDISSSSVPFAQFLVRVADVHKLSPRFTRLTFDSPSLSNFAYDGADQRLKLVLPNPRSGALVLPQGPNWKQSWLDLPEAERPIIRTYSIRAFRSKSREVDVDFVLHENGGPATDFARNARIGDEVGLIGPNARYEGKRRGFEFAPPSKSCKLLIVGDETAVPAVAAIIERLPWDARGTILLEVPTAADQLEFRVPAGIDLHWLPRELPGKIVPRGARLLQALREAARELLPHTQKFRESTGHIDIDADLIWDVPSSAHRPRRATTYTWVAAEAGALRVLRQFLISEHGVDRRTVAFMGYWRDGKPSHDVCVQLQQTLAARAS